MREHNQDKNVGFFSELEKTQIRKTERTQMQTRDESRDHNQNQITNSLDFKWVSYANAARSTNKKYSTIEAIRALFSILENIDDQ